MLFDVLQQAQDDVDSAIAWAEKLYSDKFLRYFSEVHQMWDQVSNLDNPISDAQLDACLTKLPLELFAVSEALSAFKISIEAVKFRIKKEEHNRRQSLYEHRTTETKAEIEELIEHAGLENKFLLGVYTKIIERVENEMRFTREVIMACKKIYSARHANDQPPVSDKVLAEPGADLPGYSPSGKRYVHGGADIHNTTTPQDW